MKWLWDAMKAILRAIIKPQPPLPAACVWSSKKNITGRPSSSFQPHQMIIQITQQQNRSSSSSNTNIVKRHNKNRKEKESKRVQQLVEMNKTFNLPSMGLPWNKIINYRTVKMEKQTNKHETMAKAKSEAAEVKRSKNGSSSSFSFALKTMWTRVKCALAAALLNYYPLY